MSETPDTRGPAIVLIGSLGTGVRGAFGPFPTVDAAVRWAQERPWFGAVVVELLNAPETGDQWPKSAVIEVRTYEAEGARMAEEYAAFQETFAGRGGAD